MSKSNRESSLRELANIVLLRLTVKFTKQWLLYNFALQFKNTKALHIFLRTAVRALCIQCRDLFIYVLFLLEQNKWLTMLTTAYRCWITGWHCVGEQPRSAADRTGARGSINLRTTTASSSVAAGVRWTRSDTDATSCHAGTDRCSPYTQRIHESRSVFNILLLGLDSPRCWRGPATPRRHRLQNIRLVFVVWLSWLSLSLW